MQISHQIDCIINADNKKKLIGICFDIFLFIWASTISFTLYNIEQFFIRPTKWAKWMEERTEGSQRSDWLKPQSKNCMRSCVCEPVAKAAHAHNYTVRFGAFIIIIIMFEWRKKA